MFFHTITITPAVFQSLAKVQIILDHEISLSILKQTKTTSHMAPHFWLGAQPSNLLPSNQQKNTLG